MTVVLDASALLAYLLQEPGAELVDGLLSDARMTSVNWAEVVQKSLSADVDVQGMREELQALGMKVEPFLAADGEKAGQLWPQGRLKVCLHSPCQVCPHWVGLAGFLPANGRNPLCCSRSNRSG